MKIEYVEIVEVWLDGKEVGRIAPVKGGYAFFPKMGMRHGNVFDTIKQVKISL